MSEDKYGSLLFLRKNGLPGTPYPLCSGKTCIGSSKDAHIRLKINDDRLEEIHCIIDVTDEGIATLLNKSTAAPVSVNKISIRKFKVLNNEDKIELVGKQFQYLNEQISKDEVEKQQALLNQAISTPSKKRQSVAHINMPSAKKTPNFKTKTTVLKQPFAVNRSGAEFGVMVTPERKPNRTNILEKSKTTSKIIVSKALISPTSTKKRRLSLDDNPKKSDKKPKISVRNILLSENIVSSTISEEELVPSISLPKVGNLVADFLDTSNGSLSAVEDISAGKYFKRRLSIRAPSRASIKIKVTTPVKTPKSKTTWTPPNAKTPRMMTPVNRKLTLTANKDKTPRTTPINKRLELLDGRSDSAKKLTLKKASPNRIGSSTKTSRSENLINFNDSSETLSQSILETKDDSRLSSKKSSKQNLAQNFDTLNNSNLDTTRKRQKSVGSIVLPNTSTSNRRKTEGSQPSDNIFEQYATKNIYEKHANLSRNRKSKISSIDTEDLSDSSVILNLSSGSSVSPMVQRKSLFSTDSDIPDKPVSNDPRLSHGKASPRKSEKMDWSQRQSFGITHRQEKVLEEFSSGTSGKSIHEGTGRNSRTRQSSKDNESKNEEKQLLSKSRLSMVSGSKKRSSVTDKREDAEQQSSSEDLEIVNILDRSRETKGKRSSSVFSVRQSSKMEDSVFPSTRISISRSSTSRQSLRSNLNKKADEQSTCEDITLLDPFPRQSTASNEDQLFQDESFTSSMSSNDENFDVEPDSANRSRQSLRRSSKETKKINPVFVPQRRPSLKRSYISNENDINKLSIHSSKTPTPEGGRRSSRGSIKVVNELDLLNISTSSSQSSSSTRFSLRKNTSKHCSSCGVSPVVNPTPRRSSIRDISAANILNQSASSESDTVLSVDDLIGTDSLTKPAKTSLANATQSMSDMETLNISSRSRSSTFANKSYNSPLGMSDQNISVITVNDDSVKNTPESHTSIIILDTPFEKTRRSSHKKLSKTLNSSIDDCVELATPKSVIKSRRSMSLPYKPIVEEITPVTPVEGNIKNESGFKTPLNTPGLFEDIKKTVIKSRSRRRSSNNLMEELNKAEVDRAVKRPRESTDTIDRSAKKMKMLGDTTLDSIDENLDASFESFATDEIFTNISDQYVVPNTPKYFKNLTDKPVITDPQTKSLTEPKKQRSAPIRRSLHAMRLESQLSENDGMSAKSISMSSLDTSFSSSAILDDSSDSSITSRRSRRLSLKAQKDLQKEVQKEVQHSSKNDITSITELKKLPRTPKEVKTPKNDWSQTPKLSYSPKNDLTNIVGVKKVLSTPNIVKLPKNDLTQIPNLRKLMYPTRENSPKNDLSDVAGIRKLLTTPKQVKSPRNDLRNIPNLRRIMSPKQQNSPKNDLSDVAGLKKLLSTPKAQKQPRNDLTDVIGVKKLMSSPKVQNSPKNDLTNVPNLRRIMSPKQQNSPRNDLSDFRGLKRLMRSPRTQRQPLNDLSDVEGVADIFAVPEISSYNNASDIENNADLFDKLFVKKPLRTYRGKSLSPITRKAMVFGSTERKTLGDSPYSSPRIEKWVQDQAVISLQRLEDDNVFEEKHIVEKKLRTEELKDEINKSSPKRTPRGRGRKIIDTDSEALVEKKTKGKKNQKLEITNTPDTPKKTTRGRQNVKELSTDEVENNEVDNNGSALIDEIEKKLRGRRKPNKIEYVEQRAIESPRTLRGKHKDVKEQTSIVGSSPTMKNEIGSTTVDIEFKQPVQLVKRGRSRKLSQKEDYKEQIAEVHSTSEEVKPVGRPRGRKRKVSKKDEDNESTDIDVVPSVTRGRRARIASCDDKYDSDQHQEISDSGEDVIVTPKKTRGGKKITVRDVKIVADPVEEKVPKRGRPKKGKKTVEEELDNFNNRAETSLEKVDLIDQKQESDTEDDIPAAKRIRGRKAPAIVATITSDECIEDKVPAKSKKITKAVKGRVKDSNKSKGGTEGLEIMNQILDPNAEEPVKKGNRKKIVIEDEEETSEKEEPLKRVRTRKAILNEEDNDTPELKKITKGRRKSAEEKEYMKEVSTKPTRGRRAKKVADVESEVDDPEIVTKVDRRKKIVIEEDKENMETKTITKRQPTKSKVNKSNKSNVSEKCITKKRITEEELSEESPRTTRQKKATFKKYGSDFVMDEEEVKSHKTVRFQMEEVEGVRRSKRNRK